MAEDSDVIIPSFLADDDDLRHLKLKKASPGGKQQRINGIKKGKRPRVSSQNDESKDGMTKRDKRSDGGNLKPHPQEQISLACDEQGIQDACNVADHRCMIFLNAEDFNSDSHPTKVAENDSWQPRKSERKRKCPRQFMEGSDGGQSRLSAKKRGKAREKKSGTTPQRQKQGLKPFKCDKCGTSYVINPLKRGNKAKTTNYLPSPRHKVDPSTKAILTLCNACGLAFDRPKKSNSRQKPVPTEEEREKYAQESVQYGCRLAEEFGESEATRLYCPYFKREACCCIQKYIEGGEGDHDGRRERVIKLLELVKRAVYLRSLKCYKLDDGNSRNDENRSEPDKKIGKKKAPAIGLGNGQKKSKEYREFVMKERTFLRDELQFCERGTQKILLYSNNLLHKRLKTEPKAPEDGPLQKGKAALGQLQPINELPSKQCCVDHCSKIAVTHSRLLQQWRDRAATSQVEARRVLAEMLTPSGGNRSNCYRFIAWVTGCSYSTIGKVNEQMRQTGGDREPPVHGLVKWWREHPKPKKSREKPVKQPTTTTTHTSSVTSLFPSTALVQPISILQAAANSAGLTAVFQAQQQQQQQQSQVAPPSDQPSSNVTVFNLNGAYPQGLIIPTAVGIPNQINIPANPIQLQTLQQQLQQQQLQQQIQLLQLQILQQQHQIEQQQQQVDAARLQASAVSSQDSSGGTESATLQAPAPVVSHAAAIGSHESEEVQRQGQQSARQEQHHAAQQQQAQATQQQQPQLSQTTNPPTLMFAIPPLQNPLYGQTSAPTMVTQIPNNLPVIVSWLSANDDSQQAVLTYVSTSQPMTSVCSQAPQDTIGISQQLVITPSPAQAPQILVAPQVQGVNTLQLPQSQQQQLSLAIKAAAQQDVQIPLHGSEQPLTLSASHIVPSSTSPVGQNFSSDTYIGGADNTYSVLSSGNIMTVSHVTANDGNNTSLTASNSGSAASSATIQSVHDPSSSTLQLQAVPGLYLTPS